MKTIRILWITHDLFECFFPFVKGKPSRGGSWIAPLFYSIKNIQGVKMGSITPVVNGEAQKKVLDDITYYSIRIKSNENTKVMNSALASKFLWAINDFKPDIIHAHGTEKNFGLLRKYVDLRIPIVCSIQGIINPYYKYLKYSTTNINIKKFRSLKNIFGYGGVNANLRKWKKYSVIEKEIYHINKYFIGRTTWDKAQLLELNSDAKYYVGEELLRSPFYDTSWSIDNCERNRIFISSVAYPIKGFHVLLHAIALLKEKYPTIKVVAPLSSVDMKPFRIKDFLFAEDYSNYLKSEIKKHKLEDNIVFLKRLTAEEMALQYSTAHIFVLPSFIENSPNSLGESMMIGTPTVVAPVGGVTSIIEDNESSFLFPSGDYAVLALQIDRIFSDDVLANKISCKAKQIAVKRHNVKQTTIQYYNIYLEIIKQHDENFTHTLRA